MITKTNLKIILMQILFGAFLPTGHAKKKMFISKKGGFENALQSEDF